MVDIVHRVGIEAPTQKVYEALTTPEELARWWTSDTTGDGDAGGRLRFGFGERGVDMAVRETVPGERVVWEAVDGPDEWLGTHVRWELRPEEDGTTTALFAHEGWREPVEFMHHCSTKWATFLLSLKSFAETDRGQPWPDDVPISSWG